MQSTTTVNLATLQQAIRIDKNRESTHSHLRAILPNHHAGSIIGYKGYHARRIQATYHLFLQVYHTEGQKWGRLISTMGQPEQLARAWNDCCRLLLESYPDYYGQRGFSISFVFPSDLIDLFLQQGIFQMIANECDTHMLVKKECLMRSTERVVCVSLKDLSNESIHAFERTVYILAIQVQKNLNIALSAPGNKFYIEDKDDDIYRHVHHFEHHDDVMFNGRQSTIIQNNHIDTHQQQQEREDLRRVQQLTEQNLERLLVYSKDDESPSSSSSSSSLEAEHIRAGYTPPQQHVNNSTDNQELNAPPNNRIIIQQEQTNTHETTQNVNNQVNLLSNQGIQEEKQEQVMTIEKKDESVHKEQEESSSVTAASVVQSNGHLNEQIGIRSNDSNEETSGEEEDFEQARSTISSLASSLVEEEEEEKEEKKE